MIISLLVRLRFSFHLKFSWILKSFMFIDFFDVTSVKLFMVWHVSFGNHFLLERSLNILFFRLFFVIIVYSKDLIDLFFHISFEYFIFFPLYLVFVDTKFKLLFKRQMICCFKKFISA